MSLTEKEILEIAAKHCEFNCEGTYHLNKYTGWAIVRVVRECFELAALCDAAETRKADSVELPVVMYWVDGSPLIKLSDAQAAIAGHHGD